MIYWIRLQYIIDISAHATAMHQGYQFNYLRWIKMRLIAIVSIKTGSVIDLIFLWFVWPLPCGFSFVVHSNWKCSLLDLKESSFVLITWQISDFRHNSFCEFPIVAAPSRADISWYVVVRYMHTPSENKKKQPQKKSYDVLLDCNQWLGEFE